MREVVRSTKPEVIASGSEDSKKILTPVVNKLKGLKASDIKLEDPVIPGGFPRRAVGYIPVWEQQDFEIGIFAFPPGACIPLHNHPGMCVISQVLYGSLWSFDLDTKTKKARTHGEVTATAPETRILFEADKNIHEFVAGPQGCAILDILTPPYEEAEGRGCTYYELEEKETEASGADSSWKKSVDETNESNKINQNEISLKPVKCPSWFTTYRLSSQLEKVDRDRLKE
eukprot:jgi/Bigna1/136567/aug1.34_g11275